MKSKFKGALALTMALSLAFSSMGVNTFAKDNVVVTLAEEAGFEFGSSKVKLSEGSYKLPLAMMKSTDITADSMAKSCIKDAYLTVDKNGKAKIKVNLQAVTIGAITDWAKDWKIYSSSLGSDLTAAEFTTNSEGNVDSITFELPDNSSDGVYANMFITAMASTQDCYFKLDFANAEKVFAFGSDNTYLKVGEYDLAASLKNATNIENESKAASCIKSAKLNVKDNGEATVTVNLQAVTVGTVTGWAKDWQIYATDITSEKTAAQFTTDADGNVDSISFNLTDKAVDGTYVNMYIDAMGYAPDAYIAYDWLSTGKGEEVYNGSFHIDQFGEYDINTAVSVKNNVITKVDVTGANFGGTYAEVNKVKLSTAISGMVDKLLGKSAKDAKGIYELDTVSGATYSSKGIKSSVMNALDLKYEEEVINLPTQKLEKGEYTVDISFYTDNVTHYLTENEKASAKIKVDSDGNMTLVTDIINGTKKEPLYLTEFNGYYTDNDLSKELVKDNMSITKGDISYSDTYFKEGTQVVTELQMPLVGDFAKIYNSNAHIYVPAMNNLNGEAGGVYFENGWFDTDCFLKVYWDSLTKVASTDEDKKGYGSEGTELAEGKYSVPLSMKNASDISKDSMAASCIKGAELEIKADNSAEITVDLQAVTITMFGQTVTSWAKDWKYYDGTSTSAILVDMEETKDDDGNVVKAKFKVPDNSADGVYVNMNSGRSASDAYFAIDYKNAKKINDEVGFGSSNTILKAGRYSIPVDMKNASNLSQGSMAASCLNGAELVVDENGKAKLTVKLKAVTVGPIVDWAEQWKVYTDGVSSELITAEYTTNAEGKVDSFTFDILDNSKDGTYVQMYVAAMGYAADAYLAIDYANAKEVQEIIYGDVDGNGKVELADAELLLKYVLDADNTQISEEGLANAKVSGSEALTATEAAMIRLKALNNDYKFPVEK